jgi:hypothetical protein
MWLGGNKQYDSNLNLGMGDTHLLDQDIITLMDNVWYHVALVFASAGGGNPEHGTYKVYVDGAPMPPGTITTIAGYTPDIYKNLNTLIGTAGQCPDPNDANCTRPMDIGNVGRARTQGFRGWIDDFGIYDRELSGCEIWELAGGPNCPTIFPVEPLDLTTDVQPDTNLEWLVYDEDVNSVDVYFGTDQTAVYDANRYSPEFKGNQTAATYDPTPGGTYLNLLKNYYWRIDGVNDSNIAAWPVSVWQFTTDDGAPICVAPKDIVGPFWVELQNPDVELQWLPAGNYTTSFDVYVSSDWDDVNDSNTAARKADDTTNTSLRMSPPLSLRTQYYWRVVANHTAGVVPSATAGAVWSFKTGEYYVVEDFESYMIEEGTPTPAVIGNWAKTGGLLNYYLISNDSASYPGTRSLDLALNSGTSPYYSGISRTYSYNNDYSINNTAKAVSIWYKADSNTNRLYVALKDSDNVEHIETNIYPVTDGDWNYWSIALRYFASVNKCSIKTIEIGEGDRENQTIPGSSTGRLRLDDIRLYPPRIPYPCPYGDLDGDCDVDWEDVRLLTQDWLTSPPVNMIKNFSFNEGIDGNGWPVHWTLYHATSIPSSNYAALSVNTPDGLPAPCARIDRNQPVSGWMDSDLTQMLDVSSLMNQTIEVSFDHKGNIEAPDNTMFEFRLAFSTSTALSSTGLYCIQRRQEGHDPYCPTCYGSFRWDWESYSMAVEVTESYLHIDFRLAGRADTNPDPLPWVQIDNVVVKEQGKEPPPCDIFGTPFIIYGAGGDGRCDFYDFVLLANDWLVTIPIFPPPFP